MAKNYFKYSVQTQAGDSIKPVLAKSLRQAEDIAKSNNFGKGCGELIVKKMKSLTQVQRNKKSHDRRKKNGFHFMRFWVHDDDKKFLKETAEALVILRDGFDGEIE